MSELSDQTLLTYWYRNRNAEAFHVLASRHARMVYATALRVLRDVQAAEDVSQESFLALAQAKRPPSRNVAAWLHRTAYHAALDVIRSRKRRDARDLEYSKAQPGAAHIAWDDIRELVDEAVMALPESSREPLVRYFFEQESHAAIATALGIPRQTVTHRIGKGIEQVRRRLKEKGVIAPAAAALVTLIQENSASALPAAILQEVGRTALVATPSTWAVLGSYTSGTVLKVAAAVLVVGAGVAVLEGGIKDAPVPESPVATEEGRPATEEQLAAVSAQLPTVRSIAPNSPGPAAVVKSDASMASVSGVVLLPDGSPFAGANVVFEDLAVPRGLPGLKADDTGRFEMRELKPSEYRIKVTEPESDSSGNAYDELARVTLSAGEARNDLQLVFGTEGNLTVSGVVSDSDGNPLAGVRTLILGSVQRATISDEEGRFTLRYLPDREVQVNTHKEGYSQAAVFTRAGDQEVRLTMLAHGAVAGRVIDSKTGQAIALFEAGYINGSRPLFQESDFINKMDFSGSSGAFHFPSVFAGDTTIMVRALGYVPVAMPVLIEERKTLEGVVIELERSVARQITGRVVAADGSPIANAWVYVGKIPFEGARFHEKDAETSDAGRFEIGDVSPDVSYISAFRPGYAPTSSTVTEETVIVLQKPGRLDVSVFQDGKSMYKVPVYLGHFDDQRMDYLDGGTTDAQGHALMAEVVPGDVLVRVEIAPHREQCEMVRVEPGGEVAVRFDLAPAVATVEGYVHESQSPISGGSVVLFVDTGYGSERLDGQISSEGTFLIENAPTGRGKLVVAASPRFQPTLLDDVSIDGNVSLEIDVEARGTVRGTVVGLDPGEKCTVAVVRGVVTAEEGIKAYRRTYVGTDVAGYGGADETGNFEAGVDSAGAFTLMALTYLENDYPHVKCREVRIVEVPEAGEINVDFSLTP